MDSGLIAARYSDESGRAVPSWPVNPNGAWENAAAMTNVSGNVIGIMPHPERANWIWQVPPDVGGEWSARKRRLAQLPHPDFMQEPGPGRAFFERFARMLRESAVGAR
jgi:phosphoribosylformylglycinamidine (FGAM) synthase-like amidotransferase family enzyme